MKENKEKIIYVNGNLHIRATTEDVRDYIGNIPIDDDGFVFRVRKDVIFHSVGNEVKPKDGDLLINDLLRKFPIRDIVAFYKMECESKWEELAEKTQKKMDWTGNEL